MASLTDSLGSTQLTQTRRKPGTQELVPGPRSKTFPLELRAFPHLDLLELSVEKWLKSQLGVRGRSQMLPKSHKRRKYNFTNSSPQSERIRLQVWTCLQTRMIVLCEDTEDFKRPHTGPSFSGLGWEEQSECLLRREMRKVLRQLLPQCFTLCMWIQLFMKPRREEDHHRGWVTTPLSVCVCEHLPWSSGWVWPTSVQITAVILLNFFLILDLV